MDYKAIQEILRFVNESELAEVEIEHKDFKIKVKRKSEPVIIASQPAVSPTVVSVPEIKPVHQIPVTPAISIPETTTSSQPKPSKNYIFKSPLIGTYYKSPGPDKDPFVKVGDVIRKGTVLCIVEAMKLFNEIESDIEGRIVNILVDNASPVEYDQALFEIELS